MWIKSREGLALVDRVGDHRFQRGAEAHRVERALIGDPVGAGVEAVVEDDLLVGDLALDADEFRGRARDASDLLPGLGRFGRRVDADDRAASALCAKPATMPACVPPVTEQTKT